jgi:pilus assembly protein CpaF
MSRLPPSRGLPSSFGAPSGTTGGLPSTGMNPPSLTSRQPAPSLAKPSLGPTSLAGDRANTKSFDDLKRVIHGKLVEKLDLSKVSELKDDTLRREIRLVVERLCDTENPLLNRMERERLIDEVLDETFGFGPLEILLKYATIIDIMFKVQYKIFF